VAQIVKSCIIIPKLSHNRFEILINGVGLQVLSHGNFTQVQDCDVNKKIIAAPNEWDGDNSESFS